MANPSLQIGNDNWAIKEDNLLGYSTAGTRFVPQPITMTRATLGTRVNPSGLVEDVELLGGELVVNGDFSNGSTSWNKSTQVTIENGVANIISNDGSFQYFGQSNVTTIGKSYLLRYTIVSNNNGDLRFGNFGGINSSIGSHSFYFVADETSCNIARNSGITDISIDNVSVKEATIDNLPRVDYTDGTSSLLVEPQRTNLITYSEDLNQASTVVNATVLLNQGSSPKGDNSANKFTANTVFPNARLDVTTVINQKYTTSIYAKYEGYQFILLDFKTNFNSGSSGAWFDIINGTIETTQSNVTFTKIEELSNNWYKISITSEATSSGTGQVRIHLCDTDGSNIIAGATGLSNFVWGFQIEEGSYATSYIKTSGSTVTRNQETYEKTGISDKINSEEGVLFVEMAALQTTNTNAEYLIISDGTYTANSIMIQLRSGANQLAVWGYSGSVYQIAEIITITDITDFNKIAIKWKANDFEVFLNGSSVYSLSTYTAPTGLDRLEFSRNGTAHFFGKVKQLQIFKTALSDSELATLTT